MKDNNQHIFMEDGCISEQAIFSYIGKSLTADEMLAVENHLAECEMCSDALEGYSLMTNKEKIAKIVIDIKNEIDEKSFIPGKGKSYLYWRLSAYAASVAIVLGTVLVLYLNLRKQEGSRISQVGTVKKDIENIGEKKNKDVQQHGTYESNTLIALQKSAEKSNSPATGETFHTVDLILSDKSKEDVNIPDNTTGQEEKKVPLVKDDEVEKDNGVVVGGAIHLDDSSVNGKRESGDNSGLHDEQVREVSYQEVVVTSRSGRKQKSSYKSSNEAPAKEKAKDIPVPASQDEDLQDSKMSGKIALEEQNEILKKNPSDYSSLYYSGVSYYNLKKFKKCISQLDKVLSAKDGEFYEDALWYKAQALIALNKKTEAMAVLDQIISGGKKYNKQAEIMKNEIK